MMCGGSQWPIFASRRVADQRCAEFCLDRAAVNLLPHASRSLFAAAACVWRLLHCMDGGSLRALRGCEHDALHQSASSRSAWLQRLAGCNAMAYSQATWLHKRRASWLAARIAERASEPTADSVWCCVSLARSISQSIARSLVLLMNCRLLLDKWLGWLCPRAVDAQRHFLVSPHNTKQTQARSRLLVHRGKEKIRWAKKPRETDTRGLGCLHSTCIRKASQRARERK